MKSNRYVYPLMALLGLAGPALADGRTCSTPPHAVVQIEISNIGPNTMDFYWVDYLCNEVLKGTVAPGRTFNQITFDTHPWRVREHATQALVQEFLVPAPAPTQLTVQ